MFVGIMSYVDCWVITNGRVLVMPWTEASCSSPQSRGTEIEEEDEEEDDEVIVNKNDLDD